MCFIVYIYVYDQFKEDEPPLYKEDTINYIYPLYHHFFKVYNRRFYVNHIYCSL